MIGGGGYSEEPHAERVPTSLIRYQRVCPEPTALRLPLHEHFRVLRMHVPSWLRPQGRPKDV